MAQDPQKHHFVPEFYLRQWVGSDDRLERYSQPVEGKIAVRRVFVSQVGFEHRLYSARDDSDPDPEWLEREFFQKIDNGAARVLRKLNSNPPLSLDDLEESMWSIFIRSMYHRNPSLLKQYIESGVEHWINETPIIVDQSLKEKIFEYSPDLREKLITSTIENAANSVLNNLPTILMSERVGQFLNDLRKTIIELPDRCFDFLVSDALPVRTNGLKTPLGHYVMPLNPRRALVATFNEETMNAIKALSPNELVRRTNEQIAGHARHFVAARDRSQDRFIRNRYGVLVS